MKSERVEDAPVEVGVGLIIQRGEFDRPTSGGGIPDNPQILITQRRPGTAYERFWEFPGGKAEPSEPIEACIARELREELGVEIEIQTVLPPIVHTYDHAAVRVHAGVGRLTAPSAEPRAIEVEAWRWCALDELPWEEFLPANIRLVSALVRHLSGTS